jgi:hypothetical protein
MSEQPVAQVVADVAADAQTAVHDAVAGVESTVEQVKADLHPAVAEVLQFFDPTHLPAHLAAISAPFQALAHQLANDLHGSQLTIALHNLLASKDAAVRAKVAEINTTASTS